MSKIITLHRFIFEFYRHSCPPMRFKLLRFAVLLSSAVCIAGCIVTKEPLNKNQNSHNKHLFILSGQSNMGGLRPSETFTPKLASVLGEENITVVRHARGSSPIRRWLEQWPKSTGELDNIGNLYEALMEKVNRHAPFNQYSSVTFIWMQGETDAREGHGDVYLNSLIDLYSQLGSDLRREDINFVVGRLSDHGIGMDKFPDWINLRQSQMELTKIIPNSAWVDTDDLNDGINKKGEYINNDLHYSVEGYQVLGERFAEAALRLINH